MAEVLTPTVKKIVQVVTTLSEEEQKILLAQLNAERLLKKGVSTITQHPEDVPMELINKWKHDSRKYAK